MQEKLDSDGQARSASVPYEAYNSLGLIRSGASARDNSIMLPASRMSVLRLMGSQRSR